MKLKQIGIWGTNEVHKQLKQETIDFDTTIKNLTWVKLSLSITKKQFEKKLKELKNL